MFCEKLIYIINFILHTFVYLFIFYMNCRNKGKQIINMFYVDLRELINFIKYSK